MEAGFIGRVLGRCIRIGMQLKRTISPNGSPVLARSDDVLSTCKTLKFIQKRANIQVFRAKILSTKKDDKNTQSL